MFNKFKKRREEKYKKELFRILADQRWWYVIDIGEAGNFGWASIGNIYPLLNHFEILGVIESQWNTNVHPKRRQYRLSPNWEDLDT